MKICVLDRRTPQTVRDYLLTKGIQVVFTEEVASLEPPLNTHTDIQLAKVGDELVCEPSLWEYYRQFFPNVKAGKTRLSPGYPKDVAYNCLTVGTFFFHRLDVTDPVVLEAAEKQGFRLVPVRQGYTACSTLVVSERAVVTADEGMEKVFQNCGLSVCKIPPGNVILKNFPYGFIGGAGGRVFDDEILFFGTPREEKLFRFLEKHKKTPILFPGIPEDFGGLVFLTENP
ncbi:MAG: hypothetical protein J6A61_06535 [Clostridia bacterium]|nr:hypothetical protein [Clostridia bacterium]